MEWINVTDEVTTSKLITDRGWRDGSGEKSTGRSSGGPRFDSQYPHGGSQPSLTLVLAHDTLLWLSQAAGSNTCLYAHTRRH